MFIPSIFGGNFSYPERISSPIPSKNGAATYNFHYASNCFENLLRHSLKLLFLFQRVFTRATRVLAMVMCLRLSVISRCSIETTQPIRLVLIRELPSTYPTLCYKDIQVSSKIRVLPSGTLLQTLDLQNFATASWKRVIN